LHRRNPTLLDGLLSEFSSKPIHQISHPDCASLAKAAQLMEDYGQAEKYAVAATSLQPDDVESWRILVHALTKSQQLECASDVLAERRESLQIEKSVDDFCRLLSHRYRANGELDRAAVCLNDYLLYLCRVLQHRPFIAQHLATALAEQDSLTGISHLRLDLSARLRRRATVSPILTNLRVKRKSFIQNSCQTRPAMPPERRSEATVSLSAHDLATVGRKSPGS
jgi:hypothetical protein